MPDHAKLELEFTPEALQAWCAKLETPSAAHTLAVSVALQSFISSMTTPTQRATPLEQAVKAVLEQHATEARARLLAENTLAIAEALTRQDCRALAQIHHAMSRRGFELASRQAIADMPTVTAQAAAHWCAAWCSEAKTRAVAASGFPDALNFAGAGIDPKEYAAMKDAEIYLGAAT
jgi:hypothetical protein